LFIADSGQSRIRKVSPAGVITTVVDEGVPTRPGTFLEPTGVTIDNAGSLFITYSGLSLIRKVAPDGTITTVAGRAAGGGDLGDGGPAANAQLSNPKATAIDSGGN